jgi:hypothetical protein
MMSERTPVETTTPGATAPGAAPPAPGPVLPALATSLPAVERVTLAESLPGVEALFAFAHDAELRVRTLRMVIEEHAATARGSQLLRHEIWLEHPGRARVLTRRDETAPARDYDVWILDQGVVTTYAAARGVTSRRAVERPVVGVDRGTLPPFARQHAPLTALPPGSLADTFIHPHGLFRNVMLTGALAVLGIADVNGREGVVVRADHPRSAKVLADRPDRSLEAVIDRQTGFLLRLTEYVAGTSTRHAEVIALEPDALLPPGAFELRLPADVRVLY